MTFWHRRLTIFRALSLALVLATQSAAAIAAEAVTYEATLPPQLFSAADLCAYAPCHEVLPRADSFSARKGKPPYIEGYKTDANKRKLIGYVFLSTDIVDIPGYSGKPITTLIGMDDKGVITGAKILRHGESILRLGIPEAELTRFSRQHVGKFVGERFELGTPRTEQPAAGLDAISRATVTSVAQHEVILRSGIEIARQVGILQPAVRPQASFTDLQGQFSWDEMVTEGSIQQLTVSPSDTGAGEGAGYIDIYFGYLNAPAVGKSVLGEPGYDGLMSRLQPGEHAIFIIANGSESFKGSGFARGGIYERIKIVQGIDAFIFRDLDYLSLHAIEAANAPNYSESGIFIIRNELFSSAYPWRLVFLANKVEKATGTRTFASVEKEYWLPARYLAGGHPEVKRPEPDSPAVPKERVIIFALVILLLVMAAVAYGFGNRLRRIKRDDHQEKEGS